MFRALIVFVVLAFATAFAPARTIGRANMALNEEMGISSMTGKECPKRKIDKNGKCPGESGYVSFTKDDNRTFAELQADRVSILFFSSISWIFIFSDQSFLSFSYLTYKIQKAKDAAAAAKK